MKNKRGATWGGGGKEMETGLASTKKRKRHNEGKITQTSKQRDGGV